MNEKVGTNCEGDGRGAAGSKTTGEENAEEVWYPSRIRLEGGGLGECQLSPRKRFYCNLVSADRLCMFSADKRKFFTFSS